MLVPLEAETADLDHEPAGFRARCARIVQPVLERLEAVRQGLGRRPLREIADSLEKECEDYMAHLDRLRHRPRASSVGNARLAPQEHTQASAPLLLCLSLAGRSEEIAVSLQPGERIVLGRDHVAQMVSHGLLLDLTPYSAHELGVSRKHAAIVFRGSNRTNHDVQVTDIGSANGTYLNGQHIAPDVPHRLHNSDELCLGHLRIRVRYDLKGAPFLERIRLYNLSSKSSWETNRQTWAEVLELALLYGCDSSRSVDEEAYRSGARVSDDDAQALADALEHAMPNLPDEPPRAFAGPLDLLHIESPVWYFGGQAGKHKIRDLITFCRQGGFEVLAF